MGTDRIDHCGLLADEQMAGAMEHQAALLLGCLGRHEPHVCPGDRLADGLSVGGIILVSLDVGLRTLWNISATMTAYSALMLAARITLAHFSVSSARSLPKSAGEPASNVAPRSANRSSTLGSARIAFVVLLSWSIMSGGVPVGAPRPYQAVAS